MAKVDVTVVNASGKTAGVRLDENKHGKLVERMKKRAAADKLKSVSAKKASESKKNASQGA